MDNKEIVLKDFDPDTLAALLEFMYTAKITITEDNAQDILIGANLLLLYPVREAAGEVLGRLIDCSNVLLIRSLASAFSCREVETRAHNFLLERFEMVSKTEEFLKLDLAEVKKYLLMDDIIVRSEESIFECIIRWIETDPKSRESHFEDLIPAVRFPLVSEHYVLTVLQPHPMVQASKLCQGLIREAASLRTESCRSPGQRLPQYRGSNQLLFLQCANMSPWLKTPPVLYDFKKNSWTSLNGPTGPCRYREGSSYIFHDNSIYSFGGESNMEPEGAPGQLGVLPVVGAGGLQVGPATSEILIDGEVYRYCLEERLWSVHSCMLGKRKRHQAVVLAGRVYVLGGSNEYSVVQAGVEVMDLQTGVWTQGVPMLNRRVSHGAVALNNCLYVVGGWDGQGVVKSVEMFNPTKGVWQEVSTHPNIRMKSGVAALDGKIYVVGGCLQTLESCYRAEVAMPPDYCTQALVQQSEFPKLPRCLTPSLEPGRSSLRPTMPGQPQCLYPTEESSMCLVERETHRVWSNAMILTSTSGPSLTPGSSTMSMGPIQAVWWTSHGTGTSSRTARRSTTTCSGSSPVWVLMLSRRSGVSGCSGTLTAKKISGYCDTKAFKSQLNRISSRKK